MSYATYTIYFIDPAIPVRIREELLNMGGVPAPEWRAEAISRMAWTLPQNAPFPPLGEAFQVELPAGWTAPEGVSREKMLVSAGEDGLRIVLTDASLPPERCAELVMRFVKVCHKKATGQELRDDEIEVTRSAILREFVCEHCCREVKGYPFACPICGRSFCYTHRQPAAHECSEGADRSDSTHTAQELRPDDAALSAEHPRVVIGRHLCG